MEGAQQMMMLGGPRAAPNEYDRPLSDPPPGPSTPGPTPLYRYYQERAADPEDELFPIYDRMSNSLENNRPGAERAYGPLQERLRNYYEIRARNR